MAATFDLLAHPEQIRLPYGAYVFVLIWFSLVMFVGFAITQRRLIRLLFFFLVISPFLVVITRALIVDAKYIWALKARVKKRDVTTISGCVEAFRPGKFWGNPRGEKGGEERWRIGGTEFSYVHASLLPGYNVVESRGGLVHANSRVRVSYVEGLRSGLRAIVRLEVLKPDCAFDSDPPKP